MTKPKPDHTPSIDSILNEYINPEKAEGTLRQPGKTSMFGLLSEYILNQAEIAIYQDDQVVRMLIEKNYYEAVMIVENTTFRDSNTGKPFALPLDHFSVIYSGLVRRMRIRLLKQCNRLIDNGELFQEILRHYSDQPELFIPMQDITNVLFRNVAEENIDNDTSKAYLELLIEANNQACKYLLQKMVECAVHDFFCEMGSKIALIQKKIN